jgi:hypothetical protein
MKNRDDADDHDNANEIKIEIRASGPEPPKLELKINSNEKRVLGNALDWLGRLVPFALWSSPGRED